MGRRMSEVSILTYLGGPTDVPEDVDAASDDARSEDHCHRAHAAHDLLVPPPGADPEGRQSDWHQVATLVVR